jgi:hypothetical protein
LRCTCISGHTDPILHDTYLYCGDCERAGRGAPGPVPHQQGPQYAPVPFSRCVTHCHHVGLQHQGAHPPGVLHPRQLNKETMQTASSTRHTRTRPANKAIGYSSCARWLVTKVPLQVCPQLASVRQQRLSGDSYKCLGRLQLQRDSVALTFLRCCAFRALSLSVHIALQSSSLACSWPCNALGKGVQPGISTAFPCHIMSTAGRQAGRQQAGRHAVHAPDSNCHRGQCKHRGLIGSSYSGWSAACDAQRAVRYICIST